MIDVNPQNIFALATIVLVLVGTIFYLVVRGKL